MRNESGSWGGCFCFTHGGGGDGHEHHGQQGGTPAAQEEGGPRRAAGAQEVADTVGDEHHAQLPLLRVCVWGGVIYGTYLYSCTRILLITGRRNKIGMDDIRSLLYLNIGYA